MSSWFAKGWMMMVMKTNKISFSEQARYVRTQVIYQFTSINAQDNFLVSLVPVFDLGDQICQK